MPQPVLFTRSWVIVLLFLLSLSQHTVFGKQSKAGNVRTTESTCPSRTINYITATLPQQCLRTDWSSGQTASGEKDGDPRPITTIRDASNVPSQIAKHTSTTIIANDGATSSASKESIQPVPTDSDNEPDPLSDNANFLSFEEWKAQMLQKTGQSPEHIAGLKTQQRKDARAGGINNALDGYGEDGEIEIDFGGFPVPDVAAEAIPAAASSLKDTKAADAREESSKPQKKSKEAGTTSKHRFNYASFDCAATVLKTNPGSKGSTFILSENKDSYMINACSLKNKFIIVELCEDINIDTIVLGNFEFFSSTFRSFRVSVSDRYSAKSDKWENIGTFEARNNRGIQAFLVENMRTWGRYLRIEFLTHYGAEYYCPVSLLRVHGKTMMEDWKADVKASQGEDDDEEEAEDVGGEKVIANSSENLSKTISTEAAPTSTRTVAGMSTTDQPFFYDDKCPRVSLPGPLFEQTELVSSVCQVDRKFCHMAKVSRLTYTTVQYPDVRQAIDLVNPTKIVVTEKSTTSKSKGEPSTSIPEPSISSASRAVGTISISSIKAMQTPKAGSTTSSTKPSQKTSDTSATGQTSVEHRSVASSRSAVNAVASNAPQDSFFRSVHKRLQQLEANSTLSLQYIEEQSRILREAFTKVEKRQLSKTANFLETLNATVLNELRHVRLQYDQIWQSTVLELSAQREQSQREVTALSQRLSLLADEMLWQRRLAILQFGLIMLCLALIIFSRNAAGTSTFEVPILQNMVPKQRFSRYLSFDSPPGTPSRPASRYERLARSLTSFRSVSTGGVSDDEVLDKSLGNDEPYQLPTPRSEIDEPLSMQSTNASPEPDLSLRRAQSIPNLRKEPEDLLDTDVSDDDEEEEFNGSHSNEATEAMTIVNT